MTPCESNIALSGRNRRLRGAVIVAGVSLVLAVVVVELGASRNWRLLLALPFFWASALAFQALYKTCVMRAMRGERETDEGREAIASVQQQHADRRRAQLVMRYSVITAALATALIYVLP